MTRIWPIAILLAAPVGAHAESIQVSSLIEAKYPEASQLRQIVVQPFGGNGGEQLASALTARLAQPDSSGKPHFIVLDSGGGRSSSLGIVSGSVNIESSESNFSRQQTRCVEGAGFFSCKRSAVVTVYCRRRVSVLNVSVQIARSSDRRLIYTLNEPFRDEEVACNGDAGRTVAERYAAFAPTLAQRIATEISPHTETYSVRLLETTAGLDKPTAKAFKDAVRLAPHNVPEACGQWQRLADAGQHSDALSFNLGVCAEQRRDIGAASQLYDQAQTMNPADKRIAEAATRTHNMITAQRNAASAAAQRVANEAAEAAADRKARQVEARAAADAAAAGKRRVAQASAEASAAKAKRHADVSAQFGSAQADNIVSGKVSVGMTAAQARAAVGSGCSIQRFGAGEEVWSCRGKRIGFANGRVSFVR